ncbi:hypothetical protein, partial [Nostoc sp. UIC 10630]|uniref:hypothetical protein n=1 Tax=Nostoc sp. UIC 10630 TaxID=2100146 RepID=UPI001A9C5DBD
PCNGKLLRTVLKTNGIGDNLVEFNTKLSLKTGCKNFNLSRIKAIAYSVVCNRLFNQFLSHGCTEDTVISQYLLYSFVLSGVLTSVNTLYP